MAKKNVAVKKAVKKKSAAKKTGEKADSPKPGTDASISPAMKAQMYTRVLGGGGVLPPEFVAKIRQLESALGKEVWLFSHGSSDQIRTIHAGIHNAFVDLKGELPGSGNLALLVDSPGGNGEAAYRISSLLQRECGKFTAIVPRSAKSAATLMVLGADEIIMGTEADLGPLDVQFADYDVEEDQVSALDTVQAIEQLEENASDVAIKMLIQLQKKTRKRYSLLFEHALHFASEITSPLFEKIDSVQYSRQSRMLKEAQDYAERLLVPKFSQEEAAAIAKDLVTNYPTHQFVIDLDEASRIGVVIDPETMQAKDPVGLHTVPPPNDDAKEAIDWLYANLFKVTAFGKLIDA